MKLIIQIPCLNEEATLPLVLNSIPKTIDGVDEIEILVIDDGSTDKTIEVAKQHGVKHIVMHRGNQGLSRSFHDGILEALELGADIVVNTDGDNQYPQQKIGELIRPIIEGRADIVVADRQTDTIEHFSPVKKLLQRLGTKVVNWVAGTDIPDAVSGFRGYSRDSLMRLNTITRFSYCTETIIQAGNKGMAVASVPVTTNPKTRESRLFNSTFEHVHKSAKIIIRAFIMYKPYVIFGWSGAILFFVGAVPFIRYILLSIEEHSTSGHLQSLLIGSLFLISAFLCAVMGVVAELIRINRVLIEDDLEQSKRHHFHADHLS